MVMEYENAGFDLIDETEHADDLNHGEGQRCDVVLSFTVGPQGLQLRALPRTDYAVAFTVPANTAVIIDAKNPEGWVHVRAKQSPEHWTPTPPFYGWAPPGSFPKVP